jgi:hypothetical protein
MYAGRGYKQAKPPGFPAALLPTLAEAGLSSPGTFLGVHGLIAKPALDFSVCHLGCFAAASLTKRGPGETALREPSNGHLPRRNIGWFAAPLI